MPPEDFAHLQRWLVEQFDGIRGDIKASAVEISAMRSELSGVSREQSRQDAKIERLTDDVRELQNLALIASQRDQRMNSLETSVSDLVAWKTTKNAAWTGPQKVIAGLGGLAGALGLILVLINIFKGFG